MTDQWYQPDISIGKWLYCGTQARRKRGELIWYSEFVHIVEHIKPKKGAMRIGFESFFIGHSDYFNEYKTLAVDAFRGKEINDSDLRGEFVKIFTLGRK
jgi:hypothetical protein